LDRGDNDARRFWVYVISALQHAHPNLGKASLWKLREPQLPPAPSFLGPLINDLTALSEQVLLVVDDYHVISTQAIHEGLSFLIEHQPRQLHLAMATRADPPLPLFRLRARGQLTEVRAADLRFNPVETAAFLNSTMGLELTPKEVEALEARTEGWIVGLQLAALSLQGRSDQGAFIHAFSGSHHYVLEYLTEEVLRRQTRPMQRFLVQTSILDRLCGPLCDALTGERNGDAALAKLFSRNLFVVPLDVEHKWYRYHHLFADLLANRLRRELPQERIEELHRRASEWYEQSGSLEDAIDHALNARDDERAAHLIEQTAQTLIAQGNLLPLLGWVHTLPKTVVSERPSLRLYQGWALNLSGETEAAEQILRETKASLQNRPPTAENDALLAHLAALLTGIATLKEETATVVREAREALDLLPSEDQLSRARVYVALGTAYAYEDRMQEAVHAWHQARDLSLAAGNAFLATAAIELLAGTLIYHQGRLREGARALQTVLDLATAPHGKMMLFSGTAHALLAEVNLEWNDLDAAAALLQAGIELLHQSGIGYGLIHTYCAEARLERARGNIEGAFQALQRAQQAVQSQSMWHMLVHLASCQVRLRLSQGDVETAARWAEGDPSLLGRQLPETLPLHLRGQLQISLARVHFARGQPTEALATLQDLEEHALARGYRAQAIEAALVGALAWQSLGQPRAAQEAFARSLAWAEPEGYVRLYLEADPDAIALLRWTESQGTLPGYASKLLAAFGAASQDVIYAPQRPGNQALVEPLTPRELEVLGLVREGLSNKEIAERLTITLNTVKKHSSNLYGKLGVRSRTQAIARAEELGIL
jgi:LuxR family maltose regulon positive regulatory protein